jgi:hypothetical protein
VGVAGVTAAVGEDCGGVTVLLLAVASVFSLAAAFVDVLTRTLDSGV